MSLSEETSVQTKQCVRCQVVKPISYFSAHHIRADGLQPYCQKCANKATRPYSRARQKAYRELAKRRPEDFRELYEAAKTEYGL